MKHIINIIKEDKLASVAWKMLPIYLVLMLQKPVPKSRNEAHIRYLSDTLLKRKEGQYEELMKEGREIQRMMLKGKRKAKTNEDRVIDLV